MTVLCFDIGGTNIKYGVIENYTILEKGLFPTEYKKGQQDLKERILKKANEMKAKYPTIKGVGVSCAGSINYDLGKMLTPPESIQEFRDLDFASLFKDGLGLDSVADNDVNTFAACECLMGAGKKYKNYIVCTVGTGIGGAIVINNEIFRGKDYNAGEIGRQLIEGKKWESLASMTALIREAKAHGLNVTEGKEVFDLYDAKDKVACEVVEEFYDNLGRGVANLVYIFNPDAFVVGGGISARPNFGEEINAHANKFLVKEFQNLVDVIPAAYRNDGGILGAYCNFVKRFGEK